jgi:spermidine/putrescine-binding protein
MNTFGKTILAAVSALALSAAAAEAKTLTISWWGFNGEKLDQFIVKPFQAKCGCELVFETGNNADRLNKIKIRGGAGVDVAYFTDSYSQIGIEEACSRRSIRPRSPISRASTISRRILRAAMARPIRSAASASCMTKPR